MALKSVFNAMKHEGYIIKPLDMYLLSLNSKDNDRAKNVNSPSQASVCNRANFYARMGYQNDGSIEPRARRIFDNGTKTHERLQEYLLAQGILISDEVPCINEEYNIQGHTDGFLNLGRKTEETVIVPKGVLKAKLNIAKYSEVGILEIKSINSNGFSQLKDAKQEHKQQAMIYLFCAETRRKYLQETYKTTQEFLDSEEERAEEFKLRYQHLQDGNKYTREEKIQFQVDLCLGADMILYNTSKPMTKVVFLYENKDNQDLKEYCVTMDEDILNATLYKYERLNMACETNEIPPREGTSKSCPTCRWCNYKIECFA